jgi:hypothetical protein
VLLVLLWLKARGKLIIIIIVSTIIIIIIVNNVHSY